MSAPAGSLAAMAGPAERLPVCYIPELHHVPAVWNDVIYTRRRRELVFSFAMHTERVVPKEHDTGLIPLVGIPTPAEVRPRLFLFNAWEQ